MANDEIELSKQYMERRTRCYVLLLVATLVTFGAIVFVFWRFLTNGGGGGHPHRLLLDAVSGADTELETGVDVDCSMGSPSLCSCSELLAKHLIDSFDGCTQEAAMDACKSGACAHTSASAM